MKRAPFESSFESWYVSNWSRLRGSLAVTTGDPVLAEDLAAEAFARALARWDTIAGRGDPTAWLYRVAFNEVKKDWRHRAIRSERIAVIASLTSSESQEPPVPEPELWEAVSRLPERARTAIALRYVADFTEREVAEFMGVARGTVASTLSDARKRLARELSENFACEPEIAELRRD